MSDQANGSTALAERPATSGLPEAVARRGIDEAQWRTLMNSLFPGAKSESVLMVIDYCRARKLDPLKKPCHIVPMKVKDQKTGEWGWRDVVMPGIYEYRTTAIRTGHYLGHSAPEYGPTVDAYDVSAPEWCAMTIYRRGTHGEKIEFPVRVYFREACATKFDKDAKADVANDRWSKAPIQMLTKCAEAAGLREAFPDELGGEPTADEMEGQVIVDSVEAKPAIQQPQRKSETLSPPVAAGDPPATVAAGVVIADMERRRNPGDGSSYWIVQDGDQKLYFVREVGEGWQPILEALQGLKGTDRRVELDTEQPEGYKLPFITGITPVGGAA